MTWLFHWQLCEMQSQIMLETIAMYEDCELQLQYDG